MSPPLPSLSLSGCADSFLTSQEDTFILLVFPNIMRFSSNSFSNKKEDFILWTLKNIETQSFFTDSDMYGTMKKLIGFSIHMLSMCFSLCIKTSFRAQSSDWNLIKALKLVEDSNLLGVLIFSWSLSFPQQWWKQRNRTVVLAYFTVDHHFSKLFFKWFCH